MNKSAAAVPSAEQNALAEEIDRRVAQRTAELTAANEQLRKALAEIQQSEAKLRQMIDAIPAMAWSAHPDGSGEFFNQHYLGLCRFTGRFGTRDQRNHCEGTPRQDDAEDEG